MKLIGLLVILVVSTLFLACSAQSNNIANDSNSSDNKTANTRIDTKPTAETNKLSTPQDSIEYQFELVRAGDFENLKECLTDRAKASLTEEIVENAKANAAEYKMEDLFASSEEGELDGNKTAKVIMKNGRTLTTLVETNGRWLADTIWFK